MTEEEYDALDAMPLYLDEHGGLPARLPNGRPVPSAQVLDGLKARGIITLIPSDEPDRWAIVDPSRHAKEAPSKRGL